MDELKGFAVVYRADVDGAEGVVAGGLKQEGEAQGPLGACFVPLTRPPLGLASARLDSPPWNLTSPLSLGTVVASSTSPPSGTKSGKTENIFREGGIISVSGT